MDRDLESIQEARQLLEKAHEAALAFEDASEADVDRILAAVSGAGLSNATKLAEMAVEETGFGKVEDKILKNRFSAERVYEAIRDLKTVGIVHEDAGNGVIEVASPVGVIAGIVPSTNPTSTTIYKALIALKGRNTIVFSPHPAAVGCITETARILAEAAEAAGAPPGVISAMERPTMEGTNELMKSKRTALILATGGPGLVRAAYSAGKPAFGVGPGNVPAYVESSADVARAVRHVLAGKCFDNGTLCSSEQSLIVDEAVRDAALEELGKQGAYLCDVEERGRLEKVIQTPQGTLNTDIVGKSAPYIARLAGIAVPEGTRALVAPAEGVGRAHPLSMEKLSPILAFYTVRDWREGCRKCIEILNFGGLGHTLALHSTDDGVIRQFALQKPAFRICVNTPAALGAVGYTTNLFPAMTLGCGASGGNITSDNISPLHLINIKRVAFGVREVAPEDGLGTASRAAAAGVSRTGSGADRQRIAALVDSFLLQKTGPVVAAIPSAEAGEDPPPALPVTAPPLDRYEDLESGSSSVAEAGGEPVAFVSEDDVRSALRANRKILVSAKTIVTPSARELGNALEVLVLVH